ncbi:M28 family peptidase [Asanoa sp. NPDC050611]|uniref:M28 family metallopeptidase n=1 Tax=Asanoa sp. NPDC050611 TaxID=3157098 RepID=UPI0033C0AB0E
MTAPNLLDLDRALAGISGERMAATVTTLAGAPFTGRRVGTAGGAAARAWLADLLVEAGGTLATSAFPVPAIPDVYAAPTVRWSDGRTTYPLTFGRDVIVHLSSADLADGRDGPLGVAGVDEPTGRWLLVPAAMTLTDAYRNAGGALGLLVGRAVDGDGWHYTMLAGPAPGPLPVLTVETGLHDRLTAATGAGGASWSANAPIRRVDLQGTNLHARLRSARAGGPDLLLTAHYDGVGDHPRLRQPAAADNASGVAVICEAARLLSASLPEGIGLSVALLDGEEAGALGSAHHADQLAAAADQPLVINVDGAGHLNQTAAIEAGGPAHGLLALLDQAGRHTGLPLAAGPVASDNRRYAAAGLAAVGIGAGMAGYHSPADTADRVDAATMTAICRLVVATVWLANSSPAKLSSLIGDKR